MSVKKRFARIPTLLALSLALVLVAASAGGPAAEVAALSHEMPPTGLVCTSNETSTFTLTTRTGHIVQPDGNTVFMWGLSEGSNPFQHPSPNLCVKAGETVTVVLHNTLDEPVSLVFPGQERVLANNMPSQPVFDPTTGELLSLAPMAEPGGSMTYSFDATRPGTFLYQSGTNPGVQVDMGLFGALVVRPASYDPMADSNLAYNDDDSRYKTSTEYLIIISDMDPELHLAVEQGYHYDMNRYTTRYWMYNGRGFPDTVADNGAGWLPNQPYGSLVFMHPADEEANPYPTLVRYVNVGHATQSHHPHGNHGYIIARDGHLLNSGGNDGTGEDMAVENFTLTTNPGQTLDVLFQWWDVDKWHPTMNQIPVVIPQLLDLAVGQWYSGSPYLGNTDLLPVGTQAFNQCGEYYHLAHNHGLHQITAWGVVLSGQITFTRIDPPGSEGCIVP